MSSQKKYFLRFLLSCFFLYIFHDVRDNAEITGFESLIDTSAWKHPPDAPGTSRGVPGRTIDCSDPCKILIGATTFQLGEMSSLINSNFEDNNKMGNFYFKDKDEQDRSH